MTAAGSIVGEGIIKCLKAANSSSSRIVYHIIAGDMSPEGAGLYRGNEGVIVPSFNDPRYIDELIRHCKEHSVQAIYVGADEELLGTRKSR